LKQKHSFGLKQMVQISSPIRLGELVEDDYVDNDRYILIVSIKSKACLRKFILEFVSTKSKSCCAGQLINQDKVPKRNFI
jgi:hypothetical protein